jgi:hypothetical protein
MRGIFGGVEMLGRAAEHAARSAQVFVESFAGAFPVGVAPRPGQSFRSRLTRVAIIAALARPW